MMCIKDSWWEDKTKSDYYRILEEVIKMCYIEGNNVILFKCQWFDIDNSMKVDPQYELIKIKHGSKAYVNEPFVLAAKPYVNEPIVLAIQAAQVYYTYFP